MTNRWTRGASMSVAFIMSAALSALFVACAPDSRPAVNGPDSTGRVNGPSGPDNVNSIKARKLLDDYGLAAPGRSWNDWHRARQLCRSKPFHSWLTCRPVIDAKKPSLPYVPQRPAESSRSRADFSSDS